MKKLTREQIKTVGTLAEEIRNKESHIRKGQAFFNALHFLHPLIADKIRASEFDPFHDDGKLDECIKQISTK